MTYLDLTAEQNAIVAKIKSEISPAISKFVRIKMQQGYTKDEIWTVLDASREVVMGHE